MASDDADSEDLAEGTHEPRECMACRGTGRVISNLGGATSTVMIVISPMTTNSSSIVNAFVRGSER